MNSNLTPGLERIAEWAVTYWLHSTLLLGLVFVGLAVWRRCAGPSRSIAHGVHERLWKFGAVAGIVTASLQMCLGTGCQLMTLATSVADSGKQPANVLSDPLEGDSEHAHDGVARLQHVLGRLPFPGGVETDRLPSAADLASGGMPVISSKAAELSTGSARQIGADVREGSGPSPLVTPFVRLPDEMAIPELAGPPYVDVAVTASVAQPTDDDVMASPLVWLGLVAVAWGCVAMILLCGQTFHFRRFLRETSPAEWSVLQQLDELRERLGVSRRIELLQTAEISEPVAFGLFEWRIALPQSLNHDISESELDALLAHEIAHLRRGDVAWLLVGRALTTCLAFQPLNFLARRKWQLHAEFQCDDWAVSRAVDAVSLARSLTIVAELRSAAALTVAALPAGGRRSHITDRVERLLTGTCADAWPGRWRTLVMTLAGVAVASILTMHGPSAHAVSDSPESALSESPPFVRGAVVGASSDREARQLQGQLDEEVKALSTDLDALAVELALLQPLLTELPDDPVLSERARRLQTRLGRLRETLTKNR